MPRMLSWAMAPTQAAMWSSVAMAVVRAQSVALALALAESATAATALVLAPGMPTAPLAMATKTPATSGQAWARRSKKRSMAAKQQPFDHQQPMDPAMLGAKRRVHSRRCQGALAGREPSCRRN